MRFIFALLFILLPLTALAAEKPRPGLMWNRTGLPATFPLQVKSKPGHDFIVTLTDADTGQDALAAFIEGGTFFRVLVPPGTYRLRFDYGTAWLEDEERFADQDSLTLRKPLTFAVRGIGRKAGHLIDLTKLDLDQEEAAAPNVRDQVLCQVSRAEIRSNCPLGDEACEPDETSDTYTSPYDIETRYDFSYDSYTRLCD